MDPDLEPVELVFIQKCHYKAKSCKVCGKAKTNPIHAKKNRGKGGGHHYSRTLGCATCGKLKKERDHLDLAASLNTLGSGDQHAYMNQKRALEEAFEEELVKSGLPRGLSSVIVECEIAFGDQRSRDEGNIRFFIEKALGDVLHGGGWLPDGDTFYPTRRYTFGGISARHDPNVVTELRLMIFPGRS